MFRLAIHGGAGTILPSMLTPSLEVEYKNGLHDALLAGYAILQKGGEAFDAVIAAVSSLEDNPLFNAGKGAVFNRQGEHEMDASCMRGDTLAAGAVAGISGIKNPVKLAADVMNYTPHVLLSGAGALDFARTRGYEFYNNDYFFNQFRYDQWQEIKHSEHIQLDHTPTHETGEKKFGTVGAVALDVKGNLAAATSTGGMTNKQFGRLGDTPIIGAGTYANNKTCAVSCTGHGEFFIKAVVAYDISCLIEYKGLTLQEACDEVVKHKLVAIGGEGGLIACNTAGDIVLSYNTEGMYRGLCSDAGNFETAIYH